MDGCVTTMADVCSTRKTPAAGQLDPLAKQGPHDRLVNRALRGEHEKLDQLGRHDSLLGHVYQDHSFLQKPREIRLSEEISK